MNDDTLMPFGKYKGTKMIDVSPEYLLYLWSTGVWNEPDRDLHKYIKENFSALEMDAPDFIVQHRPK